MNITFIPKKMAILKTLLLYLHVMTATVTASQQRILSSKDGKGNANGPFDEEFEKLANETLGLWKTPGLSIAVVDGDDTWAQV